MKRFINTYSGRENTTLALGIYPDKATQDRLEDIDLIRKIAGEYIAKKVIQSISEYGLHYQGDRMTKDWVMGIVRTIAYICSRGSNPSDIDHEANIMLDRHYPKMNISVDVIEERIGKDVIEYLDTAYLTVGITGAIAKIRNLIPKGRWGNGRGPMVELELIAKGTWDGCIGFVTVPPYFLQMERTNTQLTEEEYHQAMAYFENIYGIRLNPDPDPRWISWPVGRVYIHPDIAKMEDLLANCDAITVGTTTEVDDPIAFIRINHSPIKIANSFKHGNIWRFGIVDKKTAVLKGHSKGRNTVITFDIEQITKDLGELVDLEGMGMIRSFYDGCIVVPELANKAIIAVIRVSRILLSFNQKLVSTLAQYRKYIKEIRVMERCLGRQNERPRYADFCNLHSNVNTVNLLLEMVYYAGTGAKISVSETNMLVIPDVTPEDTHSLVSTRYPIW